MGFKYMGKVPKGRIVPMYLSEDGDIYSLRYKSQAQLDEVSNMMATLLSGIVGSPLVVDDTPLNDGAIEKYKIMDKRKK